MFDINLLPEPTITLQGRRDQCGNEVYTLPSITHYDHFISNGYEYIIVSPQIAHDPRTKIILEAYNFTFLTKKDHDQTVFLAFRNTHLSNTYPFTHDIVMCVYFLQNENIEIERFFDYYYKQGIEKIFMFYCGKLADRPNLPQRSYVQYVEWDHIFWYFDDSKYRNHYCQTPLYNSFAKKIGMNCNWSIFCDLDEYIKSPKGTIKEYLSDPSLTKSVFTQHRLGFINFETNQVQFESKTSSPKRGKTIAKGNQILPEQRFYVHRSHSVDSNLILIHNRRSECWRDTIPMW